MKEIKNGYVVLTSIIIISVVILLIALTLGITSFLTRLDISSSYYKEISNSLSKACVQTALLKLSLSPSYSGNETIPVGSDSCQIISVTASGSNKIISTQGQYQNSYTNLKTTVLASDLSFVGQEELVHF